MPGTRMLRSQAHSAAPAWKSSCGFAATRYAELRPKRRSHNWWKKRRGRVISTAMIETVDYHGMLADLPYSQVDAVRC